MTYRKLAVAGAAVVITLVALFSIRTTRSRAPIMRDEVQSLVPPPIAAPAPASSKELVGFAAGSATRERMASADDIPSSTQLADTAMPSMIIRVGDASIKVDSLETAIAQVTQLATRLGGYVANTAMQAGASQIRSATLTLRIPANRYEEALGGLRPLGDLETVNTNAQDVSEEYVDLRARAENARRLESRLVTLLATRTGKLDDVLAVERELARVRESIERLEGRLRYLRARAAVSTLSVTVHEAAPLIGYDPSTNPITMAFRTAWRNFVAFVAALIASLGWIVPLGAVAGILVITGRRIFGHRPARGTSSGDDPAGATA